MKKITYIIIACASVFMASCQKDEILVPSTGTDHLVFTAGISLTDTRTSLSIDGNYAKVKWEAGDVISITDGASHTAVYKLTSGAGTTVGSFEFESGTKLTAGSTYSAVYGTAPSTSVAQTYSEFASVPLYMEAPSTSSSSELYFGVKCGVMKLNLTDATHNVSKIVVSDGTNEFKLNCTEPQAISTAKDFYIALPAGTYTNITVYAGNEYAEKTTNLVVADNHVVPAKSENLEFVEMTYGVSAPFTVNASGDKIVFSLGNLQYQASTGAWRFAENQWDYIGNAPGNNVSSVSARSTQSDWIDLFGWGTSGYGTTRPYDPSTYYTADANIAGTNYDWGVYNAISNGGQQTGMWRTFSRAEWQYLVGTRTVNGGTGNNHCYKICTLNSILGLMLFPDGFTGTTNASSYDEIPEGCVFLPASGKKRDNTFNGVGSEGYYWSSTRNNASGAFDPDFSSSILNDTYGPKSDARSVRLVMDYTETPVAPAAPHDYVVIAGLKWATCNIGASSPTDFGYYFSWGNTVGHVLNGKNGGYFFDDNDYVFSSENYRNSPGYTITGNIPIESDAARVNWGGNWRMPTQAECEALIDSCNIEQVRDGADKLVGMRYIVIGDPSRQLYFPAAGTYDENDPDHSYPNRCYVWTSTWSGTYGVRFHTDNVGGGSASTYGINSSMGSPIRPVQDLN